MPKKHNLTISQELFCDYFVGAHFNNATMSYARAYHLVDRLSSKQGNAVVRASASETLAKPEIRKRINKLLLEKFGSEQQVNAQHAFLIFQEQDMNVSLKAIMEYNKIKGRIKKTVETKEVNLIDVLN